MNGRVYTHSSITARIKAIDTALLLFQKQLEALYRSKGSTTYSIRQLKSDICAMEYMKKRLVQQKIKNKDGSN